MQPLLQYRLSLQPAQRETSRPWIHEPYTLSIRKHVPKGDSSPLAIRDGSKSLQAAAVIDRPDHIDRE